MNADYRYVIAMEKYVALQNLNKEEFGKELSSLDSITLNSLLACALIKLFSNYKIILWKQKLFVN